MKNTNHIIIEEAQFFEDLEVYGSANGTEYLHRAVTPTELEDMGATAIGKAHAQGKTNAWDNLVSAGAKLGLDRSDFERVAHS